MEIIIFWLITIIVSFGMEIASLIRIYKDLGDEGYLLNIKNLNEFEFGNQINNDFGKALRYIPIVNIFNALYLTALYNDTKYTIMESLRISGCLEEMTPEIKAEYDKKPTSYNAINLAMKLDEEKEQAEIVKISKCLDNEEFEELNQKLCNIEERLSKESLWKIKDLLEKKKKLIEEKNKMMNEKKSIQEDNELSLEESHLESTNVRERRKDN